jgi:hypothetical protein
MMTQFESGARVKASVEHQINSIQDINLQEFHEFNLSRDDFFETKETLLTWSDMYNKDDMLE